MLRVFYLSMVLLFSLNASVLAQNKIIPILESGGHRWAANNVQFTPDDRYLISSDLISSAIRVWDLKTGKLVRTIRGNLDLKRSFTILALALSPDGNFLAVSGMHARDSISGEKEAIRLYNFKSGQMIALLKGHEWAVPSIAFSHDSRSLISVGTSEAILWDLRSMRVKKVKALDLGLGVKVKITPDGKKAVISPPSTTDLLLWNLSGGYEVVALKGHKASVDKFSISQNGKIASRDEKGETLLWDSNSGDLLRTLAARRKHTGALVFDSSGEFLLSGTTVYRIEDMKVLAQYNLKDTLSSAISHDNKWVATGDAETGIHVWSFQTGEVVQKKDGLPLVLGDVGQKVWQVGFARDGKYIVWSNRKDKKLQYRLDIPTAINIHVKPKLLKLRKEKLARIRFSENRKKGWSLKPRSIYLDILRRKRVVATVKYLTIHDNAFSFTPSGARIITGDATGDLRIYDRKGREQATLLGHQSYITSLACSPDGRLMVTGSQDQTLRFWDIRSYQLIASLFLAKSGEWLMWTPEGFYTGSDNAHNLIGWHINQGTKKEALFVGGAKTQSKYYRPDLIAAKFSGDPHNLLKHVQRNLNPRNILDHVE